MRTLPVRAMRRAMLALVLVSCTSDRVSGPQAPTSVSMELTAAVGVRISEFHYDNAGTDTGERIEVAGPAGTSLAGWSIVLYNGSGGAVYRTTALAGSIPATCGERGVVVVSYPVDGIQNGSPDGVALVDNTGTVVDYFSYEGSFTFVGGAGNGLVAQDIGVSEVGTTLVGHSLQRNGLGGWSPPVENSFGACNDEPPPPYDGPTSIVINELMGDPLAALSASWGEWFEVYNFGDEPVNLAGWRIRSAGDAEHTIARDVVVAPHTYAVLGRADNQDNNGYVAVAYNYFTGNSTTIWMDASDWLVLRTPTGESVDSVAWTSQPKGATLALRDATLDNAYANGPNWGFSTTPFGSGDFGTPGEANVGLSETAPAVPTGVVRITFTGRDPANDPALPVGFEDQLFATARDAAGAVVNTTITWSTVQEPAIASVDEDGVVHALAAGVAQIRATTEDGRIGVYRVPTRIALAGPNTSYVGNADFGIPTDADASDDFLITRFGYTASYSRVRNTPNWVSYDLEQTHFGAEDRCDCFTADPMLPNSFAHLTTADYTGAGAAAGFGIDRGHLMRSSDRTAGSLDNAESFYLSNIIPQTADNNQGPWNNLEGVLNARARLGADEIYIIAGVAGNVGTLKDEGRVVIPASVWKVAVIMPRNQGRANVDKPGDFELIVVDMPNVPGIRNVDWNTYRTTVNAIEAKTGYDLLALLPDHVEWLVEAGLTSPTSGTATQLIDALAVGVQDLVVQGLLSAGNASAFQTQLADAKAQLAAGDAATARETLAAVRRTVQALERGGRIDAATSNSLQIFVGWAIAAAR